MKNGWRSAHKRRAFRASVFAAIVLAALQPFALAQEAVWKPERPVELVVPAAPGGSIDGTTRLMQSILQKQRMLPVPVVVMNKPGGGQSLAMAYLDQHAKDGHYLLNSTMSLLTGHILGRSKVNFTDYTPLAVLYGEAMTLVVSRDSPIMNARDLQQRLNSDPRSLSIAVGLAVGGTNHLAVSLVARAMGVDARRLKTVVFQTNSDTTAALLGGHVDLASMSTTNAVNAVQNGRARIIGITASRRLEGAFAAVPTWKEQGVDVVFTNTRFTLGPRGMSRAQSEFWDSVLERIVQADEWKSEIQRNYLDPEYHGSRDTPRRLAEMYAQLRTAMIDSGLVKD